MSNVQEVQFQHGEPDAVRVSKLRILVEELIRVSRLAGTAGITDAIGTSLLDSLSIDFEYNAPSITASVVHGNPGAQIGLSAINGISPQPMRSDAAPALSQAITPTWTGLHTFNLTPAVPDDSWVFDKLQNIDTARILGRTTAGNGDIESLTAAQAAAIVNSSIDHGGLSGLSDDDHPQYPLSASAETITGAWTFQNGAGLTVASGTAATGARLNFVGESGGINRFRYSTNGLGASTFRLRDDSAAIDRWGIDSDGNFECFADNQEIQIGASSDLRLYHNGTDSIIENNTGLLRILASGNVQIQEGFLIINPDPQTIPAAAIAADASVLIADNTARSIQQLAVGSPLSLGNRFVTAGGTFAAPEAVSTVNTNYMGYIGGAGYDGSNWQIGSAGLIGIKPGSTWSGTNRETFLAFETTELNSIVRTRKVRITGAGHLELELDSQELRIGAGQDLRLYHDGTNSIIRNNNGVLRILEGAVEVARYDESAVAGDTRFMVYDVDNATLERVTVGVADSGGPGFKVLRLPN